MRTTNLLTAASLIAIAAGLSACAGAPASTEAVIDRAATKDGLDRVEVSRVHFYTGDPNSAQALIARSLATPAVQAALRSPDSSAGAMLEAASLSLPSLSLIGSAGWQDMAGQDRIGHQYQVAPSIGWTLWDNGSAEAAQAAARHDFAHRAYAATALAEKAGMVALKAVVDLDRTLPQVALTETNLSISRNHLDQIAALAKDGSTATATDVAAARSTVELDSERAQVAMRDYIAAQDAVYTVTGAPVDDAVAYKIDEPEIADELIDAIIAGKDVAVISATTGQLNADHPLIKYASANPAVMDKLEVYRAAVWRAAQAVADSKPNLRLAVAPLLQSLGGVHVAPWAVGQALAQIHAIVFDGGAAEGRINQFVAQADSAGGDYQAALVSQIGAIIGDYDALLAARKLQPTLEAAAEAAADAYAHYDAGYKVGVSRQQEVYQARATKLIAEARRTVAPVEIAYDKWRLIYDAGQFAKKAGILDIVAVDLNDDATANRIIADRAREAVAGLNQTNDAVAAIKFFGGAK